jgi:selenocysteine lyase/cysteine desulfurase
MTGTPSFEAIAGARAAVDYLASLGDGPDRRTALDDAYRNIREYESTLAKQFLAGLAKRPAWRVWGINDPSANRVATFGLTHRSLAPKAIATALGEQGIFTWAGNFYAVNLIEALGLAPGGVLRIGFLHYNTAEEVDRLLVALDQFGD